MSDTAILIPSEEKKPNPLTWTYSLSLCLSVIAIILGVFGFFKKPIISDTVIFPFNVNDVLGTVQVGNAVSLTKEGKLQLGEGTTITTGIKKWKDTQYSHLHSTTIGENLFVFAYDGHLVAEFIDEMGNVVYESTAILPPAGEKTRIVDDMRTFGNNIVVILGMTEMIACTVTDQKSSADIKCYKSFPFTEKTPSVNAEMDRLDDYCFALSYYYTANPGDYHIATRVGCVDKDTYDISFGEENVYSDNYMFHGIAGLNSNTYVLAKAVNADMSNSDLRFQLATVKDGVVKVGAELVLKNRTNFGFFDMDNLNDHQIICTYIDGNLNNGLQSVMLIYNPEKHHLDIGPSLDNQDGGASGMSDSGVYNFIHIRVMSETRFAVFYSNVINQGATALCISEVTPANDLIAVGPEYLVSSPMVNPSTQYYWLAESALLDNRLVLIESLTSEQPEFAHAEIHLLDIKSLPLGIVTGISSTTVFVAVSGKITVPMTLEAGKNYYGDSLGNLNKGEYVGSLNTDSFFIYVETDDGKILSDDNRLGFALDDKTLFLKVHNYTCLFPFTI